MRNECNLNIRPTSLTPSVQGAAKMILQDSRHPEQLKDEVCSPGGTSIHAIAALEKSRFRYSLMMAVEAGTKRSVQLRQAATDDYLNHSRKASEEQT